MSGVPIVPIQFFGEVIADTDETFTCKPLRGKDDDGNVLTVKQIIEYVSEPNLVKFNATPAKGYSDGNDSDSGASPGKDS